ncbi:hypothetical protein TNCV_3241531 [Trichonephila clavipes]|nr:hypothetical protein TNCV_3241531 [Trichonephila clavipes]
MMVRQATVHLVECLLWAVWHYPTDKRHWVPCSKGRNHQPLHIIRVLFYRTGGIGRDDAPNYMSCCRKLGRSTDTTSMGLSPLRLHTRTRRQSLDKQNPDF